MSLAQLLKTPSLSCRALGPPRRNARNCELLNPVPTRILILFAPAPAGSQPCEPNDRSSSAQLSVLCASALNFSPPFSRFGPLMPNGLSSSAQLSVLCASALDFSPPFSRFEPLTSNFSLDSPLTPLFPLDTTAIIYLTNQREFDRVWAGERYEAQNITASDSLLLR